MNIGDRIIAFYEGQMDKITNVVPVIYKDDGDMQWYEVCDASKTDLVAIVGKGKNINHEDADIIFIINKESCNTNLLLDLL